MTTPRLTSDGYMHWPPRDWIESLCARQPDRTWLVQAPLSAGETPLLYLLPDAAVKDRYIRLATVLVWFRVAFRSWLTPLVFVQMILGLLVPLGFLSGIGIPLALLVAFAVIGLGSALSLHVLFRWLGNVRVHPQPGWTRPDILIRSSEEWEGLYLANGLRTERRVTRSLVALTVGALILAVAGYLNLCHGIGILDQAFIGMAVWDREAYVLRCSEAPAWTVMLSAATVGLIIMHVRVDRMRRAGRARATPAEATG